MVVPDPHAQAINHLARWGVRVLAATSRRPRAVRPCFERAGLALPAVLVDGTIGIDFRTGERFHQSAFDPAGAAAVLATFRGPGLEPCVYVDDPDVDVLVSPAPSTCAAHLDYLGGLAGVEDLDAALLHLDRLVVIPDVICAAACHLRCAVAELSLVSIWQIVRVSRPVPAVASC